MTAQQHPNDWIKLQTDFEHGPTPSEAMKAAIQRVEALAYACGLTAGLARLERLTFVVPTSITKKHLVELIHREKAELIAEWNKKQKPTRHE